MTNKDNRYKQLISIFAASALVGVSQPAWSSAFQLQEQSASWLGTSFAGAASAAEDASTGYYNPAGLTRLGQEQIAISGVFVNADTKLDVTRAVASPQGNLAATSVGTGSVKSESMAILPGLHYARRLSDNLVFGFNVASPFGLKTHYKSDSIARYQSTRSSIKTADISPSLAYRFDNGLSLGAGVDALYAIAKLDSRVRTLFPANDFYTDNTAKNWGTGYHVGALIEFSEASRIGVNYRSKVKVNLKGNSLSGLDTVPNAGPAIQGVKSSFIFPETVTVSGYQDLNEQWALMSDVQWTRWDRYQQLSLRFNDGSQVVYPQYYKNTIRVAVGATYQYDDCWKFKVGTAFDKTPSRDALRRISVPDQNRTWGSVGAQYRFTKNFALDVGYAHLFFKKAIINDTPPGLIGPGGLNLAPASQSLQGTSRTRVDLVGIQLTWDLV